MNNHSQKSLKYHWYRASSKWVSKEDLFWACLAWNNGKEVPRWGLLRYRKWVPQQLGDVADMQLPCYQIREWGQPTNRSTARRHGSQSQGLIIFAVRVWSAIVYSVFAFQEWSNLSDLIWEPPSHYSMMFGLIVTVSFAVNAEPTSRPNGLSKYPIFYRNSFAGLTWSESPMFSQ